MKHKTHKGMSKRVRVSGTGKYMRLESKDPYIVKNLKRKFLKMPRVIRVQEVKD